MRNTIYRQLVFCIDTYRTWIEVADDSLYKEHVIKRRTRTDYLVSRTLVLRAYKDHAPYDKGTTWTVPEHELDKALATYRKQKYLGGGRHNGSAGDAEAIIRLATYGVIRLELVVRPLNILSNSYYL